MLSIDKINETILELERSDTTFSVCEKLAACYTVRDHIMQNEARAAKIAATGSSEFMQAINGKSPDQIMPILDELMEAVKLMHPRMYAAAIEKITDA